MRRPIFALTLALTLACDHDADAPEVDEHDADAPAALAGNPGKHEKHEQHEQHEQQDKQSKPPAHHVDDVQVMPNARAGFAEILKLIEDKYIDADVDLDALYTGATEGMLARLYQVGDHPVNNLLSPRELEELTAGTVGSIVGVGVEIGNLGGVIVVIHPIPGGPAEKGGIAAGDRILAIDGARTHGLTLAQVVDKIRGAAGTEVDLFVQRDTEEWHAQLKRATVAIQNITVHDEGGDIGRLAIRSFAENTPAELDAAIADLQAKGMRALILDLRDCPGGLLDTAVAVAGRFLRKGQTIAGLHSRSEQPRHYVTEVDGPHKDDFPLAVLVGPHTASGAEILADALQTHQRATVIGQPTLGKDSVEHIHKLSNGWGLKLSNGRLLNAAGQPRAGKGITPTLPVPISEQADEQADDAAVSVARAWLRERR